MVRSIPYIYMIVFCVRVAEKVQGVWRTPLRHGTTTMVDSSSTAAISSTTTATAPSTTRTELRTPKITTSSPTMTDIILVIVGAGCSLVVIVAVVGVVYSEIRSRSKLCKRYHVENGDCTESTKMPDNNEQIIIEELGNQGFDNYAIIDYGDSHYEIIPYEKDVCIDDHSQRDLKRNEDEDHIYAISSKQRFPLKNDSFTPENEKRNQQDSIKEKEGPNGRNVVNSLDAITHVDLNHVEEESPYAEVSWEQLPSTDEVGDGLVDENEEIGGKNNSRDVSDDDLHDQTMATILHETDNSDIYHCSKDGDYNSTSQYSGTKRVLAASDDEMNTFDH